ncbi:MAG: hypothetical protein WBP85_05355 [Terracidiphilus sp.]
MGGRICGFLIFMGVAGWALPASSQVAGNRIVQMGNPAHQARLPYMAEYKTTQVKTLADGTTITHGATEVVALDSQGRRMTSTTTTPLLSDQTPVTRVTVFDPVARTNTSWSVPGERATVIQMPAPGSGRSSCATGAPVGVVSTPVLHPSVPREKPVIEDLGTETIQGVEAHGRRVTTTIPAGAIGNNEPLVRINETWTATAPGLFGLVVRVVIEDPQIGKSTRELDNLTQDEPDASVFQPPAGYEIVNKEVAGCSITSPDNTEPQPLPDAPAQ